MGRRIDFWDSFSFTSCMFNNWICIHRKEKSYLGLKKKSRVICADQKQKKVLLYSFYVFVYHKYTTTLN